MAMYQCPHCGSKYISKKDTNENFERTKISYFCESCKKWFYEEQKKDNGGAKWLMTFVDDRMTYYDIQVYRRADGAIVTYQKKHGTRVLVPEVEIHQITGAEKYYLMVGTFTYSRDPQGEWLGPKWVELNDELAAEAMQNEAMRTLHIEKGCGGKNRFSMKSGSDPLLRDAGRWIISKMRPEGEAVAKSSGGCYVATAVYGSYDCPQVWTLRRFRDDTLAGTWYGRAFIRAYYAVSPTLVKWFGERRWFQTFWRGRLDRMVNRLNAEGVADTPYKDRTW